MAARILVIEDNEENLDLMTYLLTAFGHTALKAMDGQEGLQVAKREMPDLILCDLGMPLMDGFEALRRLREQAGGRQVPILAVTSAASAEDRKKTSRPDFEKWLTTAKAETVAALVPSDGLRAHAKLSEGQGQTVA